MMVSNDRGQLGVVHARDQRRAFIRVRLDLVKLGGREPSGFVEDPPRNTQLPDVVNDRRNPNPADLLAGEADSLSDHRGVTSHTPRMPPEVRVLRFERGGELAEQPRGLPDGPLAAVTPLARPRPGQQPDGTLDLVVDVKSAEPSPQQQVAEHQVGGAPVPSPKPVADNRGQQR
jgi:hypothetical protein